MTTQQAATALGLQPDVVRHQAERHDWFGDKRGRDWWFTPGQVERYRRESLGKPGRRATR